MRLAFRTRPIVDGSLRVATATRTSVCWQRVQAAAQRWRAARASADEAAAARRHVLPVGSGMGRRQRPPVRRLQGLGAVQRCHYRGAPCAGCGQLFERGERVRTTGGGLSHPREGCIEAAQVAAQAMRDEQVW